jgi:hypothetical protein
MKPYASYKCPQWGGICAYTDEGAKRKGLFLKDGASLLRKLNKELGLTFQKKYPSKNPAGVAVAGEVYGRMWNADETAGLLIEVCEMNFGGSGISLRVNKLPEKTGRDFFKDSPNIWLSPYDTELVRKLKDILERP